MPRRLVCSQSLHEHSLDVQLLLVPMTGIAANITIWCSEYTSDSTCTFANHISTRNDVLANCRDRRTRTMMVSAAKHVGSGREPQTPRGPALAALPVTVRSTQPGQNAPKRRSCTLSTTLCAPLGPAPPGAFPFTRTLPAAVSETGPVLQLRRCHKPCRLHTPPRVHAVAARRHADRRSKSVCRLQPVANAAGRASVRGRDPSSSGHHSSSCRVEKVGQVGYTRHLQSSVSERCSLPRFRP